MYHGLPCWARALGRQPRGAVFYLTNRFDEEDFAGCLHPPNMVSRPVFDLVAFQHKPAAHLRARTRLSGRQTCFFVCDDWHCPTHPISLAGCRG